MKNLARILSFVFHPVFIPIYLVLIVYLSDSYLQYLMPLSRLRPIMMLLLINTVLMPLIAFSFLRYKGVFTSLFLEKKEERSIGILLLFVFHLLTYILWRKLDLPESFISIFLGILITLMVLFLLNFVMKVSLHTAAVGGIIGALLGLYKVHGFMDISLLALSILFLGLIASARLLLNAHSPREVNLGALTGVILLYCSTGFDWFI